MEERNYKYEFSKALHEKIKSKIYGKVWCGVIDNDLVIKIEDKMLNPAIMSESKNASGLFRFVVNNFDESFMAGTIDSDNVARQVVNTYKHYILNKFFKPHINHEPNKDLDNFIKEELANEK